ncbi:AGAP000869-PA-like protein [Anopheles sinensis]|uniref:AGAP000869-PA-like protein n=1 Tax=Anopheles sinensis TaxID=74873 RepID=A0A084VX49_ANOSI|nr:AGAP000869-PA-like protein [Anopheles sinensis]
MKKKGTNMFELPPKCPALADKITGIFGWRHTYQVHQRQKGIAHGNQYLYKSYSLNLPRRGGGGGGSMVSSTGSLTAGGSASSSSSQTSARERLYHRHHPHHPHQAAGSSCCATEPGTPNCEVNPDSWVVVHHLQSQSGILDPEDHISDVADDREEIIASYEDAGVGPDPGVQQGGGDGASGSSVGTGSPDIFQVGGGPKGAPGVIGVGGGGGGSAGEPPPDDDGGHVGVAADGGDPSVTVTAGVAAGGGTVMVTTGGGGSANGEGSSCIEVSANEPGPLGLGLQVRRGSEPSLHQIGVTDQRSPLYNVNPNGHHQETSKRWSAAPVCRSDSDPPPDKLNGLGGGGAGGGIGGGSSAAGYHNHLHHHHHHLLSPEWNVPEEDPQQQQLQQQPPHGQQSQQQQQQQQQHDSLLPQAFNRSGRLSMQFLGADATSGYRWMDAAEKAAAAALHNQSSPAVYQPYMQYVQQQQQNQQLNHSFHHSGVRGIDGGGGRGSGRGIAGLNNSTGSSFSSKSLPRESTRKEPLGQAKASVYDSLREKDSEMLLVVNETGGPLGLTAIPDKDRGGLLVQSVEPGSRAERGRLRRGDRILEINNIKLVGLSESSVQEHLKKSLASTELRLRVVRGGSGATTNTTTKGGSKAGGGPEQQQFAAAGRLVTGGSGSRYRRDNRVGQMMIEAEEKPTSAAKVATVSPTRKMPGGPSTASSLQVANTRKLGKRIEITLTKGDHGLGFSVTTRDNPAGGHCPIYIKNILPKGAAVEDGRLKPGDRLLEVEGIPMTGKSQTEVVSILRGTPHGATLKIVVSRQQELAENVKEREIGFGVESEPKSTTVPKPPPPVMPKSSLKQSNSSNSLAGGHHNQHPDDEGGTRGGVSGSRSMGKLSSISSPKTPTVQKKPLASILKSASTNQVADLLLLQDPPVNGTDGGNGGGGSSMTYTNGTGGGAGSLSGAAWKNREILTLHIPVHDTEKAGLGVSVKGKTGSGNSSSSGGSSSNASRTDGDLGIFVKSVLHGGAASRDGRLKMNDQLLSVNGVSLLGQSNAEAMETLRRAMLQQSGGSYPGKIILTVARRIGRPVSTGELLETMDPRPTATSSNTAATTTNPEKDGGNGGGGGGNAVSSGTTVIYLSADKQQQQQQPHRPQDNGEPKLQQSKRYSNPVLDRLTGGSGTGGNSSAGGMMMSGSNEALSSGGASALRTAGGGGAGSRGPSSAGQQTPPTHGLRNESYYMATGEHWNTTSSATSLNGSNAVLIEEDPEPTSPTFHLARPADVGGVAVGNGATSTPNGADTTYASQLSLETNPPPSDAFSRDAIGRRSMSEKHHAAMDARETGTYQRNKKLREERERDNKLLLLGGGGGNGTSMTASGGSMESISHQMARIDSLRHGGRGGGAGRQQPTAALAAHLLRDEAQDQLGDLGPSLGMKKSSSLESLQTMVQEIQMADEPRGPNALRTPRGRGRDEILRALVEQPPEANQAKKHWLLEDAPPPGAAGRGAETAGGGGPSGTELPDGGFVSRNSPFQSSLNDGKGAKLRVKKSGGLLRGIGHMFRFGKHRKDGIASMETAITSRSMMPCPPEPVGGGGPSPHGSNAWMWAAETSGNSSNGGGGAGGGGGSQKYGGSSASTKTAATSGASSNSGSNNNSTAAASRYIVFEQNSVERSASSGVVYGHQQPPHYQPPPPPPGAGSGGGTSIHHTDVFNHRYSHYVNYEELQQQISRRHHHYHSQRSARNTPPVGDIGLLGSGSVSQQHQPPSHHHHSIALHNPSHAQQQQQQQQQKYKSARPTSCYYDNPGGGYETISSIGPPLSGGGSLSSTHRKTSGSGGGGASNNNNNNNSSATSQHTLLTVSSSSANSNGNSVLPEDVNGSVSNNNWHQSHHHPGANGGGAGISTGSGSMRNTRGPFVTQVKIQNQMYQ